MWVRADSQAHRHPVYWFDDGSLIVRVPNGQDDVVLFRLHDCLLRRHSKVVLEREWEEGCDVPTMTIPPAFGVRVQDFTSLLAHLYHDNPLSPEALFEHVAAVLRVTSLEQLNFPSIHTLARSYLKAMFPSGPSPFVHPFHLEEALALALRYDIASIRKGLYYSIMTKTDFEPNLDTSEGDSATPSKTTFLTRTDIERCRNLMDGVVNHFTAILFEPPVTPHMECTNVLADKWFPLVIQSAIAKGSVYKPLEALEEIKQINWAAEGLCAACIREKREEWTNEQEDVWEKMDAWLKLDVALEM